MSDTHRRFAGSRPVSEKAERIMRIQCSPKDVRKVSYTHQDKSGMLWRFSGGRPVSALADLVMRDCGVPLP